MKRVFLLTSCFSLVAGNVGAAPINVLWWDSTPQYGTQAPDALRKEMSDFLDTYELGSVFDSTYVSSETPGTLSLHLASNTGYDVIVFDATSASQKFNDSDLDAVKAFYSSGKDNLMFDGDLYVRSIDYNATSDFPGVNGSTGALTVNEVFALGNAGGGILVGTDHDGFQVDADQIVNALLPGAEFTGITIPSTDGVFFGNILLNGPEKIAASDIFAHWDSIPTQAIAPTGKFLDFLGNEITLSSLVDVADDPGGGTRFSYVSTSLVVGDGETDVDDDTPGGDAGGGGGGGGGISPVPLPGSGLLLVGAIGALVARRRKA